LNRPGLPPPRGERTLKIDVHTEQVVLAAMLVDAATRRRLVRVLPPERWQVEIHRAAVIALAEIERRKVAYDPAAVKRLFPDVDIDYLAQLTSARPEVPADLSHYVEGVRWDSLRAEVMRGPIADLVAEIVSPQSEPAKVKSLARGIGQAFDAWRDNTRVLHPEEVHAQMCAELDARLEGHGLFPYGLDAIDVYQDQDGLPPRLIPGMKPGKITIVTGTPGCLTGDTLIGVNRARIGHVLRLDDIVHRFNGGKAGGKIWRRDIPTMIRYRAEDGYVRLGQVAAAFESGVKPVFRLKTESGKRIKATGEHRFLSNVGWRRLLELRLGDLVWVAMEKPIAVTPHVRRRKLYRERDRLHFHPFAARKAARRFSVPTHRLVVEAAMNGLSLSDFVRAVRTDPSSVAFRFIDPSVWTVHHRDEDPKNNALENLEVLPRLEHYRLHGQEGGWKHVTASTRLERVTSVEALGEEMTYDIAMCEEPHNFIANGFVVHNSGKSTLACRIALGQIRQKRRVLYGAWEMTGSESLELLAVMSLSEQGTNISRKTLQTGKGPGAEEMVAAVKERARQISPFCRFVRNPFQRGQAEDKKSNDRNLDIVQHLIEEVGADVLIADLWERCLVDDRLEAVKRALFDQQKICDETKCHGVLLHQQRKGSEGGADPRPTAAALRGTGAWWDVGDTILGTFRPGQWKAVPDDLIVVDVLKQRWAPWPLSVEVEFDPDRAWFGRGTSVPYDQPGSREGADEMDGFLSSGGSGKRKGGRGRHHG
jgi:Intein splicing domain/DnaB-like helicase N terminal domain